MSAVPTTSLEAIARDIADELLGTSDTTEAGERGLDIKTLIEVLLPIVIDLFGNCKQSRSGLIASIRRPALRQRSYARSVVISHCAGCGNARLRTMSGAIVDALCRKGESLDEATLKAVIEEALDPAAYLSV